MYTERILKTKEINSPNETKLKQQQLPKTVLARVLGGGSKRSRTSSRRCQPCVTCAPPAERCHCLRQCMRGIDTHRLVAMNGLTREPRGGKLSHAHSKHHLAGSRAAKVKLLSSPALSHAQQLSLPPQTTNAPHPPSTSTNHHHTQ